MKITVVENNKCGEDNTICYTGSWYSNLVCSVPESFAFGILATPPPYPRSGGCCGLEKESYMIKGAA